MISEKWRIALMNVTWRDIETYMYLSSTLKYTNISECDEFKKRYNYFYKVRQKKSDFYKNYYEIMEREKENKVSFESVLREIHEKNGTIEASFTSKLLSTIDDGYPIWDTYVLQNLRIKAPNYGEKNRIEKVVETYGELCEWYKEFLKTDECKEILKKFDDMYPSNISEVKKIDFLLWNMRD